MNIKEQLHFLKELQNELKNQDNDYQASPRFWVVMDYKNEPCWEEFAEKWTLNSSELDMYGYELEEFKKYLQEYGFLEELHKEYLKLLLECEDEDVFISYMEEFLNIEVYLVPERNVSNIKKDTFFITKEECQKHIDSNKHHYTSKAHTYAMTAWRSPQVEKLWNILENLDIEKLIENT